MYSYCVQCWETFAGQKIYQVIVVDYIVTMIKTAIVEPFLK